MSEQAYPLAWPQGWPRTTNPARSRFAVGSLDLARRQLAAEIGRMGGQYVVISTNLPLRRDGNPYATAKRPDDPGVAVYFVRNGKSMVFACDRWDLIQDNIRAIQKTIEAMRGIERWGASDMMERAFSAFEALPAPKSWHEVLEVSPNATAADIERAYRAKARAAHPDTGGSHEAMTALNTARQVGLERTR